MALPERWRLWQRSVWNQAGKVTVHALDPATHVGPQSYISQMARLTDGRNYLDRTASTVIEIITMRLQVNGTYYKGRVLVGESGGPPIPNSLHLSGAASLGRFGSG